MHSQPCSGQSAAFVQIREQKPRSIPLLSVNRTHLSSLHSELFVQSSPSDLVPELPPEEEVEELDELDEVEEVDPPELDPPELEPPDDDEPEPLPPSSELQATVVIEMAKKTAKASFVVFMPAETRSSQACRKNSSYQPIFVLISATSRFAIA